MTAHVAAPVRFAIPAIAADAARRLAWAALGGIVLLQVYLALTKGVNWDEFFHFSQIHEYRRGLPVNPTQSPHVWLFGWIAGMPGSAIDHILAIRVMMLPFELLILAVVIDLARRFASRDAALLCALALASGGYAFTQALVLRADTIAAALAMAALWIALTRRIALPWALAVAVLLALAAVATIKVVIYAPAFAAALLLRGRDPAQRKPVVLAATVCAVAACTIFYALITALRSEPTSTAAAIQAAPAVKATAQASATRMFDAGLFPRGLYLLKQVGSAPVLAVLIAISPLAIARSRRDRATKLALGCLMLPLVSVAIYRNAFPYFYAFILPPVAVAIAPAAERAVRRYGFLPLAGVFLASAAVLALAQDRATLERQRTVEHGIAEIFPEPVWHFSEDNFPGAFPRGTRYLVSGWGLETYRANGFPQFSAIMDEQTVPMVLANGRALNAVFSGVASDERLLPADEDRLRASYVPHWGYLFVAGKRIPAGSDPTPFEIFVPGTYTVEDAAVTIDGVRYSTGETVQLDRGSHRVSGNRNAAATLRWGDHLPVPATPFPLLPIYSDY